MFSFPDLLAPIDLSEALSRYSKVPLLFADPAGEALCPPKGDCVLLVGPEGDLTATEKALIKQRATFFKLTPTILRAQTAAVLSVGMLRSL